MVETSRAILLTKSQCFSLRFCFALYCEQIFRNPIKAKPIGSVSYFDKRSGLFSIRTLFKNPMYVIMGLTALAAIFLPKLVDKDAMEEMQREMQRVQEAGSQQQGQGQGQQSRIQSSNR